MTAPILSFYPETGGRKFFETLNIYTRLHDVAIRRVVNVFFQFNFNITLQTLPPFEIQEVFLQ